MSVRARQELRGKVKDRTQEPYGLCPVCWKLGGI